LDSQQWVKSYKVEYIVNEDGLLVQSTSLKWSAGQWKNNRMYQIVYDENQNIAQELQFEWSQSYLKWLKDFKTDYTYNEMNVWITCAIYGVTLEGDEWNPLGRDEVTYDAEGVKLMVADYGWDIELEDWYPMGKDEYYYSTNCNSIYYYTWKNDEWYMWRRHDSKLQDGLVIEDNSYTREDEVWVHTNKGFIAYNENQQMIFSEGYRWDNQLVSWIGSGRYDYFFDAYGSQTEYIRYEWKHDTREWIYQTRNIKGFNDEHIFNYSKNSSWDTSTGLWMSNWSNVHYYKKITSIEEGAAQKPFFSIYPNPCSDFLYLDFEDVHPEKVSFKIFSALGQIKQEGCLAFCSEGGIQISHLKSGLYFLQLISDKQRFAIPFVKQ
jgi:Secretion system C-terminal sorting domain